MRGIGTFVETNEQAAAPPAKCLRIQITLRNTQVFELDHPLTPDIDDPTIWGPGHEAAYGRTFDELVRQGFLHDPTVKPAFAIVDCPEPAPQLRVARGWRAELGETS